MHRQNVYVKPTMKGSSFDWEGIIIENIYYMERAITLAQKGEGFVSPNPMVGAVIVKDNKIIGEGYHQKYGELHAERNALKNCTCDPSGSIMYVTLEPCCHHGKTPPCTDAIIESGIKKIYISMLDPNPLVAGKGVEILKKAGIDVRVGLMESVCIKQNEIFLNYIKTKKPFVIMKYAMTLDGKIATTTGKSKWITNEKSRNFGHTLRNKCSAIMVGVDTVIIDNPMLNCRIPNTKNPIRIICDTTLRMPLNSNIANTSSEIKTIIATCEKNENIQKKYIDKGIEIIVVSKKNNHIDIKELIQKLSEKNIDSILVEGGGNINFSVLDSGLVNRIYTFIAPKIFGGKDAKSAVSGTGFLEVDNKINLKTIEITNLDEDILIESEVSYTCSQV